MRLVEMARVHPAQDNSRVCGTCGHQVGIYPSGQRALRQFKLTILCTHCAVKLPAAELVDNMPAADWETIAQEGRDSVEARRA